MDFEPIFPAKLQRLWSALELRVLVLVSLLLQVILISTGNRRKYSKRKWVAVILWLSYLSADSVATLALGVLSQAGDDSKNAPDPKHTINVFWAPFLLMHLGGPDTITAYALADNELWSRHLLGLVGQVSVAIYIYLRSFTGTRLDFLWIAVFSAGVVKYGERSWVLFSASKDRYRDSLISRPDPGPNYAKFTDELVSRESEGYRVSLGNAIDHFSSSTIIDQAVDREAGADQTSVREAGTDQTVDCEAGTDQTVDGEAGPDETVDRKAGPDLTVDREAFLSEKAGYFFETFKKLFADLILSFQDREMSVSFFNGLQWKEAFTIVEIELGLVFDLFYTKSPLVTSGAGALLRIFSCSSTVAALVVFIAVVKKNEYPENEVIITYILLVGAVFLELYAIVILKLSKPDSKRWSNMMGQYNVLNHCLNYRPKRVKLHRYLERLESVMEKLVQYLENLNKFLEKYLFWRYETVEDELKKLIFIEVKERAKGDSKNSESYWKDKILLEEMDCFHKNDKVEFDQSLLVWHLATDICYYTELEMKVELGEDAKKKRDACRWMSDYMMHMLIMSPFMLPSGIGQIRFQDTYAEANEFFKYEKKLSATEACQMLSGVDARFIPSDMKGDRSKSLFFDARRLAKSLCDLEGNKRWDKIAQAWVDMLTFAAAQCSWTDHAEKLNQGGELLTHIWLLMAHFGMTDQFQISQGYIRAKLDLK